MNGRFAPPRQHKSALSTVTILTPSLRPIMHGTIPVDMTIVCLDIHERILARESQSERTALLSSDIVASGLD
jgi:hypothetical protein